MGILSESQKRRQQLTSKVEQKTQTQAQTGVGVDSPMGYTSLRNQIASVDTEQEQNTAKSISNLIMNRVNARKQIASGQLSSGNEAQDYLEMRKGGLVDMFADYMMQNKSIIKDDAAAKLLEKQIKENPDSIIGYMKSSIQKKFPNDYQAKTQAIDDYIMKGGKLNDVMDFVAGNTVDAYGTQAPEKLENTNPFMNFLGSVVATPIKEVAGVANIIGEFTGKNKEREGREQAISRLEAQEGYNDAVKNGFVGSEEEYKSYLGNVADASYKTFKQATDERVEKNLYNPNESGAELGNVVGDIFEIVAGEILTAGMATPELAATKFPKVVKYTNKLFKLAKGGAEFQALEDAYEGELSDVPEYVKSAGYNVVLGTTLDVLGNVGKKMLGKAGSTVRDWFLGTNAKKIENTLANETEKTATNKINIIKDAAENNNAKVTPQKEIAKQLVDIREKIQKDVDVLRSDKRMFERNFEGAETPESLVNNLNESFSKLADADEMGYQVFKEVPKFNIGEKEIEAINRRQSERGIKKSLESSKKALDKANEDLKGLKAKLEEANKGKDKKLIENTQKEYDAALEIQKKADDAYEKAAKKGGVVTEKAAKAEKAEAKRLSKLSEEERADILRKKELETEKATKEKAREERRRKYEMTIDNEELLRNGYSKDQIALIDVLKEEWNKKFVIGGAEFNEANLYDIMKLIESKSTNTEGTQKIVEALRDTMDKVLKDMGEDYAKMSKETWNKSDLLKGLDDILGKLTKRTSDVGKEIGLETAGSKVMKSSPTELFKQINEAYKIDMNNEIQSWLLYMTVYDPENAAKLASQIYPSLPGLIEFAMNASRAFGKKQMINRTIANTAKSKGESKSNNIRGTISNAVQAKAVEGTADYF